jgi:hypothetical protein
MSTRQRCVALATLAAIVTACGGSNRPTAEPARARRAPTTVAVAVPSADGAETTALRLTAMAAQVVPMAVDDAIALQRSVAAGRGTAALVAKLRGDLAALDAVADRSTMSYWVAPLAVRLRTLRADSAEVDVWYVGVLALPGGRTSMQWRTVSYRLVWERDAWRELAESAVLGPEPQPLVGTGPSGVAEFGARLAGFQVAGVTR